VADKLIQCLRLGALALSLYGYLRFYMRRFKLPAEFGLVLSLCSLGLVLFVAGCIGVLYPATWMLLALGLALTVYSLWKKESLRPLFTPGTAFWLVLCAFSLYICYGQVFYTVDNFSHWATAVKVLLNNNAFPTTADVHIYFPNYPLGSSVLIYWCARIANINSEWFQMLVQAVLISSCLCCIMSIVPKNKGYVTALAYIAAAVFCFAVLGYNIQLTSLYVDNLIAIIFFAALWLWLSQRNKAGVLVPVLLLACYLVTIKQSAIYFSVIIALLVLLDKTEKAGGWKSALVTACSFVAVKLLWSIHYNMEFGGVLSEKKGLSLAALFPDYAAKTADDISTIIHGMVNTVLTPSVLAPILLMLALNLVLAHFCKSRKRMTAMSIAWLVVWLAYCVGQGAMYIFCMNTGEAVRLAAFDRYFATVQIFASGSSLSLALLELSELSCPAWQQTVALLLSCGMSVANISPNMDYYIRAEKRIPSYLADTDELMDWDWANEQGQEIFWAELRSEFDRLIEEYKIPSNLRYIIFLGDDYGIEARLMANYLLSSGGTFVCTDDMLSEYGQDYPRFDYYIVLQATEANMAFIQSNLGTTARAGYTY
jgi:hypothetical protein